MDVSVAVHDDPELVTAVRVGAAQLTLLGALADLASAPLDQECAQAMRDALDQADDIRPLLEQMRAARRPNLRLVPTAPQEQQ